MMFRATYSDASLCRFEAVGWSLAAQIAVSRQPVGPDGKAELRKLEVIPVRQPVGSRRPSRSPSPAEA